MGIRDQDQDHVTEPARPPLTAEQARQVTAQVRKAMDAVRRSVEAVLSGGTAFATSIGICVGGIAALRELKRPR